MLDYLKKKLNNTISHIADKQKDLKEEIFNTLIDAEVCYDLADKISRETLETFKITNDCKESLNRAISNNINSTHNNLKKGVILFVGFQGHGKTTNINKLAYRLIKQNFTVAVTSLDNQRPAALEQLKENSNRFKIPFITANQNNILEMAKEIKLQEKDYDYMIVDTSGINSSEEGSLNNLKNIISILKPSEIILVMNSMLGHSMFQLLESFKKNIPITGCIMTNVDGDKKGGGFLSFYYVMKVPILFISNGEKIQHLEKFNAKSITNILIGEMDLEGLQDLVENNIPKNVEEMFLEKIMNGIFTFNELLIFTHQTSNIGLGRIASSLGVNNINQDPELAKKNIKIVTAIIHSMTKKERNNQVSFTESRFKRIALGSGCQIHVVKQIYQYREEIKLKSLIFLKDLLNNEKRLYYYDAPP
jgi:signal recognition particle subunit SRP54